MDLNARLDVNCGRKDGRTAKAGATKMAKIHGGIPIHLKKKAEKQTKYICMANQIQSMAS